MNGIFKQTGLRGGVHTLDGVEDVVHFADKMCGKMMSSTHLTHMPEGLLCRSVLVQEYLNSEKEFFLKIDYDYTAQKPKITYSIKGGMPPYLIKKRYPDSLKEIFIDPLEGLNLQSLLKVAGDLGINQK